MSIAGDGPLRPALEATARRLGIQHVVRFLGSVPFAQMRQLYAEHDLLAVTSESEGLPVAVLEGMASRVPVVAPEVPFITEMTPNAGRMVATFQLGNTESLVKAIVRLMDNPELVDEMEAIAWDWVQSLTWDATASEEWEEMSLI